MSTVTTTYFNSASLRQRFLDELDRALGAGLLQVAEHTWLSKLTVPPSNDLSSADPDPVRVDRIVLEDGSVSSLEFSAALLLSHAQTADARIYLFTLASGLEAFADRQALLTGLVTRFAGVHTSDAFECEKVDGDVFTAQMRAIVEFQAESIRQLTAQLRLMPSLFSAVGQTLDDQLRRLLPDLQVDPLKHLMRMAHPPTSADEGSEVVLMTQTLAQTAFEDFCKASPSQGVSRQFLDARGRVVGDAEASLFTQALRDTISAVPAHFATLLNDYWTDASSGPGRRTLAIHSYRTSLCHELYQRIHDLTLTRHERDAIRPLLLSRQGPVSATDGPHFRRLVLKVGHGVPTPLAGTFVLQFSLGADASILWFTPEHSLRRFDNLADLTSFCSTPEGREMLHPTLAIEDQQQLMQDGPTLLSLEDIGGPLFSECVDSILGLQVRNLHYVTGLSADPAKVSAMVDDALDVRQLVDPRQLHFSVGRWSRALPIDFTAVWQSSPADDIVQVQPPAHTSEAVILPQSIEGQPSVQQALAPSWLEQTQASDESAEHLRQLDNALVDYAGQALQAYLCVASSTGLQTPDVSVRWLESSLIDPSDVEVTSVAVSESLHVISMDLVSLLLERISGHRPDPIVRSAQILILPQGAGAHLDVELVNFMLERVSGNFVEGYLGYFERSRTGLARHGDQQLQPVAMALALREDALRLDLALRQRMGVLESPAVALVRSVLDAPIRAQRAESEGAMTEVFSLSLVSDDHPGIPLSDSIVLWQPLKPEAGVMFWCSLVGWHHFASPQALGDKIIKRLRGVRAERWLGLLGERDRALLRHQLRASPGGRIRVQFIPCNGHAVEVLQQSVFDLQLQNLQQLCIRARRCRFEANLFTRLAKATELDTQLIDMLDGLAVRIDNTLFEELLPAWLKSASAADLRTYNDIWRRYYLVSESNEDFLFGIPTLSEYARSRLAAQLQKDFPSQQWDPDQIMVTLRKYVAGLPVVGQIPSSLAAATIVRNESLTDYAINRFVDFQDSALSVDSADYPEVSHLMSAEYVRGMIRQLDVGTGFMAMLRGALNPADANWTRRNQLFVDQLPPMIQAVAMQQKLEGDLSEQAFAFISRVVEMPDGIAREPVEGIQVIISALGLVADEGMTPDIVKGLYVICPADPDSGPLVLHAVYRPEFIFREYASHGALLDDIRTDRSLQKLLLERLDPEVRQRYDHGGFAEPHLPFIAQSVGDVPTNTPGPITLSIAPERGNALQMLFTGALDLLVDIGIVNTVTTEQADQASRQFLGWLGLEQVLSVLPGKLAVMVGLWQGHTLLRASAASASGRRWGEAVSEFSAALGVMATAREQADKDELIGGDLATGEEAPPPVFVWAGITLTAGQLKRLHALEAKNISLKDLRRDELLSLYMDSNSGKSYAAVAGRVYQVQRRDEDARWMIVGVDGTPGPTLVLDDNQRWQLDLGARLKGGGGALTKMRSHAAELSAEDDLLIEATGMPEIRMFYRERARHIGEAHLQAKRYLENCLDNLNVHAPGAPLDARVSQIIGDFFGVNPPGHELLVKVEHAVKALFDEVMDASLSPYSSPRFVVGSNRPGRERTMGFVIKKDPKKRLFLTERFFDVPPFPLTRDAAAEGFEMAAHYRAGTLIHELSHLALDTHDIAYLESTAPYPDLLLENNANNIMLKADIERLQNESLSHLSDKESLFLHLDEGEWRDLDPEDGHAFGAVLKGTKSRTLEQAREVFIADAEKRSRVILSNADSVTLLILRLGRRNFVVPTPSPTTR